MKCIFFAASFLFLLCSCRAIQDVGYLRHQLDNGADPQEIKTALSDLKNDGYLEADWALADLDSHSDSLVDLKKACDFYKEHADQGADLYAKCVTRMSYQDVTYRDLAHQLLLDRYRENHKIASELAKFYTFYADVYKPEEINLLIEDLEKDPENRNMVLHILLQNKNPQFYADYIKNSCSTSSPDEERKSVCTRLRLKIAKIENNETEVNAIIGELEKAYTNVDQTGLSATDDETLYRCANILLAQDIGTKHLTDALKIAGLGQEKSERLFLLAARYEYKRKYFMPTDTLLAGLEKLAGKKSEEAQRLLGEMYAQGFRVPGNPLLAEKYLVPIATSPKAALCLGHLYLSGKLGTEKLQQGIDMILFAARNGEFQGYADLAEAFNGAPGIKANHEYAWIFAKIASVSTTKPENAMKLQALTAQLETEINDLEQSKHVLQTECAHINAPGSSPCLMLTELWKKQL